MGELEIKMKTWFVEQKQWLVGNSDGLKTAVHISLLLALLAQLAGAFYLAMA